MTTRRHRRTAVAVVSALVVVVAAAVTAAVVAGRSSAADLAPTTPISVPVKLRDQVRTITATGTVQYQNQRTIQYLTTPPAASTSGASGSGTAGGSTDATAQAAAAQQVAAQQAAQQAAAKQAAAQQAAAQQAATQQAAQQAAAQQAAAQEAAAAAAAGQGSGAGSGTGQGGSTVGQSGGASTGAAARAAAGATTTTTRPPTTTTTRAPAAAATSGTGATNPSASGTAGAADAATGGASGPAGAGAGAATRHVLTWLPELGSLIDRNQPLFRVDDSPTYLMFGLAPAYRQLDVNAPAGPDIQQLNQNLSAIGCGSGVIDSDVYGYATASGVAAWESSVGLDGDGVVQLGEIAFAPGPSRVTDEPQNVGADVQSGASVVSVSSDSKEIDAQVDTRKVGDIQPGQAVDVKLPDQTVVAGTVATVGTAATGTGGTASSDDAPTPSAVTITVTMNDPDAAASVANGVQVTLAVRVETHPEVLTVPTGVLIAGPHGQPTVHVVGGATIVVKPGLVADGFVELLEPDAALRDGVMVAIPT